MWEAILLDVDGSMRSSTLEDKVTNDIVPIFFLIYPADNFFLRDETFY